MTQQKSRLILFLPALILILNELIRTFLRPIYGQTKYGLLSDILGWLPNFLAPFGFMSIAIVIVIIMQDASGKPVSKKFIILLSFVFIIIGLTGFLLHEIAQRGTGLTFDMADIYATLAGIFFGACLFLLLLIRPTTT
jgi:hypothetical protein